MEFNANQASRAGEAAAQRRYYNYSQFASACKSRLKRFVKENPTQTHMIYAVPLVVPGAALFDPKTAINHVIHKLKEDNFNAQYVGENLVYISWKIKKNKSYEVKDYVGCAVSGNKVQAVEIKKGPGTPINPVAPQFAHSSHMNKEVERRMKEYSDDSTDQRIRAMYNGSYTHEDALKGVARAHGRV